MAYKWNDEQLKLVVTNVKSFRDVLFALGLKPAGGNYVSMKAAIARLNLDTTHWLGQGHLRGKTHDWSNKRSFKEQSVVSVPSLRPTPTCIFIYRAIARARSIAIAIARAKAIAIACAIARAIARAIAIARARARARAIA